MKHSLLPANYFIRAVRLAGTLAAVCLAIQLVAPQQVSGQRRTATAAAKATTTPDALVFGDRNWVYYLPANTAIPQKLAKGNFPALSPDRKYVAYCLPINTAVFSPASGTVMLLDLATGKSKKIFTVISWIGHLRWSPNGDQIAFTAAYPSGKRELGSISPDGQQKLRIIAEKFGANDVFSPEWAPDGQSVYFHDMSNLFQISTTFPARVLQKTPLGEIVEERESVTSADSFVPSPNDPNVIAYTRSVQGSKLFERTFGEPNTALFLYNQQSKTHKRVTTPDILALDPVWSRDGRFIYFSGYHDREGRAAYPFKVYRINPDGTGLLQIAAGENPGV